MSWYKLLAGSCCVLNEAARARKERTTSAVHCRVHDAHTQLRQINAILNVVVKNATLWSLDQGTSAARRMQTPPTLGDAPAGRM